MLHLERSPYFRGLLRRNKVCIDPNYPGECRKLFKDETRRKSFVAKRGIKLDDVGQLLWDCGICDSRPGYPTEILDILDQVLDHQAVKQSALTFKLAETMSDGKLYRLSEIRRAMSMGPDADVGRLVRRLRQYPFSVSLRKVKTASGLRYGVVAADLHKLKQFIPAEETAEALRVKARKGEKWWKLPADHPRRLYMEFNQARAALMRAKGEADDNGWIRSENWHNYRESALKKAQRIYDEKRAAWEAAGSPQVKR